MKEDDIEVGMMLRMLNWRNKGDNLGTKDGAGSYFSLLGFKNAIMSEWEARTITFPRKNMTIMRNITSSGNS